MVEDRRVLAGEAILSGAAATECSLDDAVEKLVREHTRLVYRIAYAVLRQHQDAEDAAQEVFMRVFRYKSKLGSVENPKTWLARIAWRVAVDRSKRNRHAREIALDDPEKALHEVATSEISADRALEGDRFGQVVGRLIAALPEKLRAPLILSVIEEMSPREIAATLSINEAAVRSRVFRARQILKEKLANGSYR